eukprot:gene13368-4223_t
MEVKPKQIKDIVVRKRFRSKEKDKPSRKEVRKDELSKFNPILPAYREKTDEEVSMLFKICMKSHLSQEFSYAFQLMTGIIDLVFISQMGLRGKSYRFSMKLKDSVLKDKCLKRFG